MMDVRKEIPFVFFFWLILALYAAHQYWAIIFAIQAGISLEQWMDSKRKELCQKF